ncbi:hypothetical protein [Streptomyces platensis]|uniref:hypothetical protein n=1 Tax=Streptomyces platensis TaxID=58346 RepID=UPI0037AE2B1D
MQLLALILYNADGGRRVVSFRPGALNVVTGQSASGKSTLLDIFEYCTGRKTATFPIGPMTDTVSWYAALFQLDTTRAFAARPAPVPGKKTAEQAMLKFGPDLEPPPYTHLAPNTDRHTLRQRLGRFIGIEENHSTTPRSRGPSSTGAHLGHATLLCLQGQSEIADKNHLFHLQSDRYVAVALKQTLPYFLGVAPHDQARKYAQLNAARSRLKQVEKDLKRAQDPSDTAHVTLAALWHEAHALNRSQRQLRPTTTSRPCRPSRRPFSHLPPNRPASTRRSSATSTSNAPVPTCASSSGPSRQTAACS